MQTLRPIDPVTASDKIMEDLAAIETRLGRSSNMLRVMAHSPAILEAYINFNHAFEQTCMTPKLRSLIAMVVAQINGCEYTLSIAMTLGHRAGLSDEDLKAARRAEASDPQIAAALRFAADIVRDRGRVDASAVEQLQSTGYNDQAIVEIIALVGLNLFRNYFNLIAKTEVEFSPVK